MKYLKKFENFDFGRFNNDDESQDWIEDVENVEDDETLLDEEEDDIEDEEDDIEDEREMRTRVWGDELVEGKKDSLRNSKKHSKKNKDSEKSDNLTAAQKRLPVGLRKALADAKKK